MEIQDHLKRLSSILISVLLIPSILYSGENPDSLSIAHENLFDSKRLFLNKPYQPEQSIQSTGPVFLKSMLLPGWGQLSSGANTRARTFFIAEGLLWSAFASFQIYSHLKQNDLENYAVQKAGVNETGKIKSFYTDVSNYTDIFEHNEEMRRFRRYDDAYPIDENHFWQWSSEEERQQFDKLRLSSSQAHRNSTLVLGAILVNHVISGIDAIFVARRQNRKISSHLKVTPTLDHFGDVRLSLNLFTDW